MQALIHPAAMLFTEDGTFIVRPVHDKFLCQGVKGDVPPDGCLGCRYHWLVAELIWNQTAIVDRVKKPEEEEGHEWQ